MFVNRALFRITTNVKISINCVNLLQNCHHARKLTTLQPLVSSNGNERTSPFQGISVRNYAKNKDRGKDKGKSCKTKVVINESQLGEVVNVESIKSQMQKAIDLLKDDFVKHLSVRSSAGSIESIVVELDGKTHTLQEIAQIVRKNPKTIIVNMAVFPQAIPAALKAIEKSGMNLNPQQDGTTLFIPIPKVTTEHRENLAKNAKSLFIKCRDAIRDVQSKQMKLIKKKDKLSQDVARSSEQQIVAIADGFISQAEKILESKQKELVGKE